MEHSHDHQHHAATDDAAAMDHDHTMHDMPAHGGHDAHAGHGAHTDHSGHEQIFRRRFWVCLVLTLPVLVFSPMIGDFLGFTPPQFPGSLLIGPVFAIIIFIYGGLPFLQMARPEIDRRQPGMMTLISLAITVAFLYSLFALFAGIGGGFFWEMATLIDVMLLGHWLEMRSVRQASGALDELAKLMPDTAERIAADGSPLEVRVSELKADDLVLVRPGASIPVDGQIEDGSSAVNESAITGESVPVEKQAGDKVIAGTINGDGSLRVRVSATGDQTALAGIMRLVQQAQSSRSNAQLLADRAAGWLFYIALAVAALTAVAWTLAEGFQIGVLERAVTVLVIACPHALGLAIPLVVAISTSLGAKNGILVRDRHALEAAREIDTVIFDKTGTLTEGRFGVTGMVVNSGNDERRALALAAAVEGDSEHPIARGLRAEAETRSVTPVAVTDFSALKGRGAQATFEGRLLQVGGPRLLESVGALSPALTDFARAADAQGQAVVYLIDGGQPVAAFSLADVVRPESKSAVDRLHALGKGVVMLTGDSRAVAEAVGRELGIDTVLAEVLPDQKQQKVAELQQQGKKVVFVGDGVNDAPALTQANVGIAIGSGTDVAVEAAGIILIQNNPLDVVSVFELSRATYRKMIQNLIWATGYNVVALPLAAGVLAPWGFILSPAVGAAVMSLSTIIVALNAQLLRRVRLSSG